MNDKEYELNDELLSAYIDGELSADERAAVEARLESDPAARQLLHQLRSVSESVQALPQEKLQHELSDAIFGRVCAMRGSPEPKPASDRTAPNIASASPGLTPDAPSRLADTLSKASLFHTKRAWMWASLALAAGLMIMIVQSGDESANKLPPVAQRIEPKVANEPADESLQRGRRELTRAPAPAAPPVAAAAPESATVAAGSQAKEQSDRSPAATPSYPKRELPQVASAGKPAAPAGATSSLAMKDKVKELDAVPMRSDGTFGGNNSSTDLLAESSQLADRAAKAGAAVSEIPAEDKEKAAVDDRKFVVVHVVATPDAFKNKSFDQLLEKNGIKLEPQPAKATSLSTSEGKRYTLEPQGEAAPQQLETKVAEVPTQDLVLVEGSKTTIDSFMAELKESTKDFVRIDVNRGSIAHEGSERSRPAGDKTVADNLGAYNRGARASGGKDANRDFDYYYDKLSEHAADGSTSGGQNSFETNAASEKSRADRFDREDLKLQSSAARAVRVDWLDARGRQLGEQQASGRAFRSADAPAQKSPAFKKKMAENAKPSPHGAKRQEADDTLKVLFVLSPTAPAVPSAAPTTPPK